MTDTTQRRADLLALLTSRRMAVCLLSGFSSGLPLYVLIHLIPAWLETAGVSLELIGLAALTGLPYTWKVLWAPALDRYVPPLFGRRRGWAMLAQVGVAIGVAMLGLLDPVHQLPTVMALAFAVAFFSASQDITVDALRRELLADHELGLGNAIFVNAYRVSSLVPGSLSLILSDHLPWSTVFPITAAFMGVGVLGSLIAEEPEVGHPRTLREAVVEPIREFLQRDGVAPALRLLAFLLLYKLGDSLATSLLTPFYLQLGFTKTQVGSIAKVVGLWSTVVGAIGGGLLMTRIGIYRALWLFGVVQMVSILGFAALAEIGPEPWALAAAVCFEYLGVGLGTAAFVSFMASATDTRFTATQFALFSSIVAMPRTLVNASAGYLAGALGWTGFFMLCCALALPGMAMLPWVAPWGDDPEPTR